MKNVLICETGQGVEVTIDGAKIEGLYEITVKKTPDGPIKVEMSGAVTSEVRVGL